MSADSFIDTNVFLYNIDDSDPNKYAIASSLIHTALETGRSCISYQVVQECLNSALRKAHIPLDQATAERYLNTVLIPLWKVSPTPVLYRRGLELYARYRLSYFDSLIVAAALEAGCNTLYSEDLQNGQRIEQLTIRNPFIE